MLHNLLKVPKVPHKLFWDPQPHFNYFPTQTEKEDFFLGPCKLFASFLEKSMKDQHIVLRLPPLHCASDFQRLFQGVRYSTILIHQTPHIITSQHKKRGDF